MNPLRPILLVYIVGSVHAVMDRPSESIRVPTKSPTKEGRGRIAPGVAHHLPELLNECLGDNPLIVSSKLTLRIPPRVVTCLLGLILFETPANERHTTAEG
jgi:hypothetical protein